MSGKWQIWEIPSRREHRKFGGRFFFYANKEICLQKGVVSTHTKSSQEAIGSPTTRL